MKSRFTLFQPVVADRDLTEADLMGAPGLGKPAMIDGKPGVRRGTHGAIIEIYEKYGEVGVEFFDDAGETIDLAFIPESYVRPMAEHEPGGAPAERSRPAL
jgi:hypothetical protein